MQPAVEVIQRAQPCSDLGRVTGECRGHVGPWLWIKEEIKDQGRGKTKYEECRRHTNQERVEVIKEA
jgi:hypothetical protein